MESSERMLLVRILELCVSAATDTIPFSCFNAFSRVDVRVDVKIPGGVHAYAIDLRGERCVLPYNVRLASNISAGTMQPQRSGRRPTSPLSSAPSYTRMTLRIGLNVIERWTPSQPRKAS
jgi:hypothetical protein